MRVGETIAVEELFGCFISPEVSVLWKLVLIKSDEIGNTQIMKPSCIVTRSVDEIFCRKGPGASTKGTHPTAPSPSWLEEAKRELQIRQAEGLASVGGFVLRGEAGAEQRFLQSRARPWGGPSRIQTKVDHFCKAELGMSLRL